MKRVGWFLLVCLVMASLASCAGGRPPSETVLQEDLKGYIKEHNLQDENGECSIEKFEVVKRKTSSENGSDEAYVNTIIKAPDGSMQTDSEFKMTYEKYNDGWHLESTEMLAETVMPLVEPDYAEEELINCIQAWYDYPNLTDMIIYDKTLDMERRYATYSVTACNERGYVTEELNFTISVFFMNFGYAGGGWGFNGDVTLNSARRIWDLDAKYSCTYRSNKYSSTEYELYAYMTPGEQLHYIEGTTEGNLVLIDLDSYTGEHFLTDVIGLSNRLREYYNRSNNVRYEGMDFSAMRYAFVQKNSAAPDVIILFGENENDVYLCTHSNVYWNETLGGGEIVIRCYPVSVTR